MTILTLMNLASSVHQYQLIIGMLQWIVSIGSIDKQTVVTILVPFGNHLQYIHFN